MRDNLYITELFNVNKTEQQKSDVNKRSLHEGQKLFTQIENDRQTDAQRDNDLDKNVIDD